MNKVKFEDLIKINDNKMVAISCPHKNQAKIIFDAFNSYRNNDLAEIAPEMQEKALIAYGENLCITNLGTFGARKNYKDLGCKIYKFEDIILEMSILDWICRE